MPAAITKEELLAVTTREFDKLEKLLETIDEDLALRTEDDTSI